MIASSKPPYRVLVVDDERIARAGLRDMLGRFERLRVVGEARDSDEALVAIRELRPDIVFLDIQMPEHDGFHVTRAIAGLPRQPACVFVTAHPTRALEAYDVDAVDYLHKPFTDARLARSIQRAARFLRGTRTRATAMHTQRLLLRTGKGAVFVDGADIARVSVEGNYLRFFVGDAEHVVRRTMGDVARELREAGFIRISRSDLVNTAHVRRMRRLAGGRYEFVLERGSVTSSRRYQGDIRGAMGDA